MLTAQHLRRSLHRARMELTLGLSRFGLRMRWDVRSRCGWLAVLVGAILLVWLLWLSRLAPLPN